MEKCLKINKWVCLSIWDLRVVLIQEVVKEGGVKKSGKTGDVIYGKPPKYLDDVNVS